LVTFRRLQVSLGLFWLLDALLQFQPTNLSASFARGLAGTAMGQPAQIQRIDLWTAGIFSAHPLAASLVVGLIQVALGAAILWPRTRRIGLICSIPWGVTVWALGEGFGGLFTGFSTLPSGAPGAALLYSIVAITLLPRRGNSTRERGTESAAHYGLLGDRGTANVWGGLWFAAALLQVIPVVTLGFKLSANIRMTSLGEPSWLGYLDHVSARVASSHGVGLTAVLVVLELTFASAAIVRDVWRTRLLVAALFTLPLLWLAGENLGGLLTGSATDPGAMPLYAVLAIGLLPLHYVRPRSDSTAADSWAELELLNSFDSDQAGIDIPTLETSSCFFEELRQLHGTQGSPAH
jgi:hypothetical protein